MDRNQRALNDVRRKIGEVMHKGDTKVQVGYTPAPEPDRKEGETWYDRDGKQWTVKNGIKQSITKLQDAKSPWFCPQCGTTLTSKLNDKFWKLRGKCYDCVVKEETKMRLDGTWSEYEEKKEMQNQMAWLKDKLVELMCYMDSITDSIEMPLANEETGRIIMVEKWSLDLETVKKDLMRDIIEANRTLDGLEKEYKEKYGSLENE